MIKKALYILLLLAAAVAIWLLFPVLAATLLIIAILIVLLFFAAMITAIKRDVKIMINSKRQPMKANDKQKLVIDTLISQLKFYKTSNDLGSPTHHSDNDEIISMLEFDKKITEKEEFILKGLLAEILTVIRKVK